MAVQASSTQVEPKLGRVGMVVAGVVALATSAVLAMSWIDTGGDSTCSAVVHPGDWWNQSACRGVMSGRSILVLLLFAAGCVLLVLASARRVRRRQAVAVATGLVVVVSLAALIVNERVRSGGLL